MTTVAVVIPHVPIEARKKSLQRALESVFTQSWQPDEIHIAIDKAHEGPGATRTRGLNAVQSEWTVYLDDDDWLDHNCIRRLLEHAQLTEADVIYPWFRVANGDDPFPDFFGKPWDDNEPRIFPVTYLVRTEMAKAAGGFPSKKDLGDRWAHMWDGTSGGEDWYGILALIEQGAKIVHLPERLWTWEHGGQHFSGSTW